MLLAPADEPLAEALAVLNEHGDRAEVHVAERLGAMIMAGDADDRHRWIEIAAELDRLLRPPGNV